MRESSHFKWYTPMPPQVGMVTMVTIFHSTPKNDQKCWLSLKYSHSQQKKTYNNSRIQPIQSVGGGWPFFVQASQRPDGWPAEIWDVTAPARDQSWAPRRPPTYSEVVTFPSPPDQSAPLTCPGKLSIILFAIATWCVMHKANVIAYNHLIFCKSMQRLVFARHYVPSFVA